MIAAIQNTARHLRMLFALLGLLALATSAAAECAWVLWAEVHSGSNAGWYVTEAFRDAASCFKAADYFRPADKNVAKAGGDPTSRKCLPDTVDPRGPKGK